jgi:tripartite-type tricarboxylate transporter receptor subunit TctC
MRCFVAIATAFLISAGLVAGCAQASQPSPTKGPSAAPAQAESTKAPAASPADATKAPTAPAKAATAAPSTDYPAKGKTITIIQPWPAGGGSDVASRMLASMLEKELGIPVQVVNKPGAGGQIGATDFVRSKPDGYTLLFTAVTDLASSYMIPDRKAIYTRKDFVPVALQAYDPMMVAVKGDSPYKDLNDLVQDAKARPGMVKASASGVSSAPHLAILATQNLTGAAFAAVQFEGAAPALTALMGGHVDVGFGYVGAWVPAAKNGGVRGLAILDKEENRFFPGVKSLPSYGYQFSLPKLSGYSVPVGTPKAVVDVLATAMKKVVESDEHRQQLEETGQTSRFMGPDEFAAFWDQHDRDLQPLLQESLRAQ